MLDVCGHELRVLHNEPAYEGILETLGSNSAPSKGRNGQQLLKTCRWPISASMCQQNMNMAKLWHSKPEVVIKMMMIIIIMIIFVNTYLPETITLWWRATRLLAKYYSINCPHPKTTSLRYSGDTSRGQEHKSNNNPYACSSQGHGLSWGLQCRITDWSAACMEKTWKEH